MYNPNFKPVEFDGFRKQAGLNSFVMTPKRWIEKTNAIGITYKESGELIFENKKFASQSLKSF